MLRRALLAALPVLLAATTVVPAEDALARHLAYVQHVEVAADYLDRGNPMMAIVELTKALDLRVPQSYYSEFRLRGTGATAHYLMACAHSMMGRPDKSVRQLEQAMTNGFSDPARALEDPCLDDVREHPGFERVAARLKPASRSDAFAGKTVLDEAFGKGLILQRKNNFPKLGEMAPEIALERTDGTGLWKLSSLRGRKPVVLVFGSFT